MTSRTKKIVGSAAIALAGMAVVPVAAVATPKGPTPSKTAICHYDKTATTWSLLTVSTKSVSSHMKHGDGVPTGAVPGQDGYVFDSSCVPTPAVI